MTNPLERKYAAYRKAYKILSEEEFRRRLTRIIKRERRQRSKKVFRSGPFKPLTSR